MLDIKELSASDDNLTGINVNVINEGQEGLIWISTEAGIHIYDGERCKNIFYGSNPGLHSLENVKNIVHQNHSVKYFLYDNNVSYVDRYDMYENQIDSIPISSPIDSDPIEIIAGKNNDIWSVSQTIGQVHFRAILDSALSFSIEKSEKQFFLKVISSKEGFWLIDSSYQFFQARFNETQLKSVFIPTAFNENVFHSNLLFKEDSKGRLWLSPYKQPEIWVLLPNELTFQPFDYFSNTLNLYQLWEDNQQNLIFGFGKNFGYTSEVFFLGNDGQIENWTELAEYSNIVKQIYSNDFKDFLFCGTYRNTFLLKRKLFGISTFLKDKNVSSGSIGEKIIRGFTALDDENILVSTEHKTWYIYNTEKKSVVNTHASPNCTYDNLVFQDDMVWSKTCFGTGFHFFLTRYDPKKNVFKKYYTDFSLGSFHVGKDKITCVGIQDDKLKIAVKNVGSDDLNPVELTDEFLLSGKVRIYFLHKKEDDFWMGTTNGLYKISIDDTGMAQVVNTSLSMSNNRVFVIDDYQDKLMLSTSEGVVIYDPITHKIKKYDKSNGLSNNTVCATIVSGDRFWVPTFSGLNIINRKSNTSGVLHRKDGISDNEFNTGAAYKTNNGLLFFGTINGVVVVDSAEFLKNGDNFKIGVSNISEVINAASYECTNKTIDSLAFKGKIDNTFRFELFSSDFYQRKSINFYYTINNEDKVNPILNHTLVLTNLPLGENRIWVYAISKYGFRCKNPIQLTILIEPFFYKTKLFVLFVFLLVFGLTLLIYYGLKRRKEHRLEMQKRKIAQLELNVLQAQLNPHFIFNSLGAIQNYIHRNNHDKADKYIAEFAQLMRAFLESSKLKYLTVSEEIDLLRRYTAMERMRFDEKFNVQFNIHPDIDVNNTIIPTFLLQPFVENAINHGLFHKMEKGGYLKVSFMRDGKGLINIIIEDNGIGREEARRIKRSSIKSHKSRAMKIIDEKSKILKSSDNYIVNINIIDLKDEHQNPIGTRVKIDIPELE